MAYQVTIIETAKELLIAALEKGIFISDPSDPTTKIGDDFIKLVKKVKTAYTLAQAQG